MINKTGTVDISSLTPTIYAATISAITTAATNAKDTIELFFFPTSEGGQKLVNHWFGEIMQT